MPSNTTLDPGSLGDTIVTKERTHDGDSSKQQGVFVSGVSGTEGAYTFVDVAAGGGVEADALRVTIASDSTGVLSVDDNGGSLTVDGTVAVTNAGLTALNGAIAGTEVQVDVLTMPSVAVTNAGTFAVQNTAATPAGTNNIGDVDVLTVPADPFGVNADAGSATGSISAKLRFIAATGIPITGTVTVGSHAVTNAGTFAVQATVAAAATSIGKAEDAAHVTGDVGVPALTVRANTAVSLSGADNDYQPLISDTDGRLHVNAGTVVVASHAVTNAGTFAVQNTAATPAGTNNIGDVDVLTLPALVAGTANIGDVDVLTLPALVAGTANIGDVDIVTMPNVTLAAGTNTNEVVGDAAHDAAAAGNPVLIGGYASAAAPTAVSADADVVRTWHLLNGAQATVLTAAGALIGGDATNGLDVDVTRLPALVAGTANIGDVDVLTIAAGDNNIGNVDVVSLPALAAGTNNIGDVDVLSVVPGTGATDLGKATDAAAGATDTGVVALAIRDDALTTLTPADGDYAPLRVSSTGALHVTGGGGGTQFAEDAAHTTADVGTVALAVRRDTAAVGSTTDGDYSTLNVNATGRLYTSATVDAALPAGTNNIGDVDVLTLPALVAGTANIGDVDVLTLPNVTLAAGTNTNEVVGDAAHDAAAAGNPILVGGYASAAAPTSVSADADVVRAWYLRNGAQATVLTAAGALIGGDATNGIDVDITRMAALVAGTANIGDVDVLTLPASTNTLEVVGDVADDVAQTGNPILCGAVAVETDGTDPTTVSAEGDAAYHRSDRARRLLVSNVHPRLFRVSADYASAQTNASVQAAPGASLSLYITDVVISNGAVAGNITLLDGSGGTVLLEIYPAINGGVSHTYHTPLRLTANTALCITSTTVTTHSVMISGYTAP